MVVSPSALPRNFSFEPFPSRFHTSFDPVVRCDDAPRFTARRAGVRLHCDCHCPALSHRDTVRYAARTPLPHSDSLTLSPSSSSTTAVPGNEKNNARSKPHTDGDFTPQLKSLEADVDTLRDRTLKFSKDCAKYRDGLEDAYANEINFSESIKGFYRSLDDPFGNDVGGRD